MGLLLSPDHTATLTDPLTWKDNPFVARDLRRDIKKRQPFVSICWMSCVLLLAVPWAASLLWSVRGMALGDPMFLGGDIGTRLCVVVSGIHIWFVIGAARKHANRLFTQESNQNTLSGLLMLPASPFQILVQTMAYPWLAGMRMALALLPLYVLCVGLDGPTWSELAMLYLVFALAALRVPLWSRPALSEQVTVLSEPKPNRAGLGVRQNSVGTDSGAASLTAAGWLIFRIMLIPVVFSWTLAGMAGGAAGGNGAIEQYLPHSVAVLSTSIVVSWPLAIARLLVTPLDWFGIAIVPLPFVLVLVLLGKYTQLVRASEFLSVGAYRDLPLQSTYLPRVRLAAGLQIAQAFVVAGYLWKLCVADGALRFLAPRVGAGEPGLAGFAVLLLCFAALWSIQRGAMLGYWQFNPIIRGERTIVLRCSLLDGVRFLCEPFALAAAFYLACCLAARTAPFPPLINAAAGSLGPVLLRGALIGLSGAALSFGVARLFGATGVLLRLGVLGLIVLGVVYGESVELRSWLASLPQISHALAFIPQLRRFEILSPSLGVLHVVSARGWTVQRLLPAAAPWQAWVFADLGLGGALWLAAHLLKPRAAVAPENAVTIVFNPTVVGREVFSDPVRSKAAGIGRSDTPVVQAAIAALQRVWDNAVVTRELRSRLRGQWERPVLLTMLGLAAAFSLVFFHPALAMWPTIFGGWLAFILMGPMNNPLSTTAAGILGCWYLVLFFAAFGTAFSTTGAFYAEAQKSTLGFLLSTPMSTRSIVLGKAAGLIGPSAAVLASISAWTLLLTLLFLPLVGPYALVGWFLAVSSAATYYLALNAVTYTISAMFPKLSMTGAAWVWILLLWFGGIPMASIFGVAFVTFAAAGLQGSSVWFAFIAVGWLLILLSYVISLSSIQSMRRRDLGFATTKRSN
jgi:hypothetical protein